MRRYLLFLGCVASLFSFSAGATDKEVSLATLRSGTICRLSSAPAEENFGFFAGTDVVCKGNSVRQDNELKLDLTSQLQILLETYSFELLQCYEFRGSEVCLLRKK